MYGNGRMFARALRTRVVGYGESGNSILRDHPSCWRIHAYAFFEADDGADIPWQAPLKDGVSENHPIATRFREFFKEVVAPYARFAKAAKASELVPYTVEWSEMAPTQRAEVLFGKGEANGPERLRALPKGIQEFVPPDEMEMLRFDGVAGQRMLTQLEEHAKYARHVIGKRDAAGYELQEEVLRALNPKAFAEMSPTRKADVRQPKQIRTTPTARVTVQLRSKHLARLRELFEIDDDRGAITAAVRFALKKLRKRK